MLSWIYSLWYRPPPRSQAELDASLSSFTLIEGPQDERAKAISVHLAQGRNNEVNVVKQRREQDAVRPAPDRVFAELLAALPTSGGQGQTVGLPNDIRSSILTNLIKQHGADWLALLESIAILRIPETPQREHALAELRATWAESPYSKGHCGSMRDFTLLSYPESPLTVRVLRDVHRSLAQSLQGVLRRQLECDHTPEDASLLQEALMPAIRTLIDLHTQAVRNTKKAAGREGRLPLKWEQDRQAEQMRIAAVKAKGVDAKWEGPVRFEDEAPSARSTLSAAEKAATRMALEGLFRSGPPSKHNFTAKIKENVMAVDGAKENCDKVVEGGKGLMRERQAALSRLLFG